MIISEKQTMQLIHIAEDYYAKIGAVEMLGLSTGDPEGLRRKILELLNTIINQQSDELKDIE